MSIGENIKTLRKHKKLTQRELADKSGLNIGTIQGYEQGKYEPKSEALHKLRKALDCNIYEILDKPFEEPNEENGIFLSVEDLNYMFENNISYEEFLGVKSKMIKPNNSLDFLRKPKTTIETTDENFVRIADCYHKLNHKGRDKAIEQVELLTKIPEYQRKCIEENATMLHAAHERTDIETTEEMKKHDDDIMNDENF